MIEYQVPVQLLQLGIVVIGVHANTCRAFSSAEIN
jgi:hypothetical protein